MNYREKIKELGSLILQSNPTYVLTGAGISTESGIPDFRSPKTGLWSKVDPMKQATVTVLRADPDYFWCSNLERYLGIAESACPNTGHQVLAQLEDAGLIKGVITQNIDGLHQKAGSKQVLELHGHLRSVRCMSCHREEDFFSAAEQVKITEKAPRCSQCQGVLRPNVVLFEDPMDDAFSQAVQILPTAELLLVVGTSLNVYPVASLPELVDNLVIINLEPTAMDSRARLVINHQIGQVLEDLRDELQGKGML